MRSAGRTPDESVTSGFALETRSPLARPHDVQTAITPTVTSAPKSRAVGSVAVPFVDLEPMNRPVKNQVLAKIDGLIDAGDFTNGAAVEEFEHAFARYGGRHECVGVASGLDALRLALLATELAPGAGVIVPAATFAATFEAVMQAGGRPVVVDIGDDYGVDVDQVDRAAGESTHVMPVHLYGQLADLQSLEEIAVKRALTVIEDACQAHGASRSGVRPGDLSRAAAFSFYPSKNLGAMGDAGALVTDDAGLAATVRALRVHGETRKYHHEHRRLYGAPRHGAGDRAAREAPAAG